MEANLKTRLQLTTYLNYTEKSIYPELEDLIVTPSLEVQNFKSEKYGYNNVKVNRIETENLDITPTLESQSYDGLYKEVNVKPITGDTLNIEPSTEAQSYEGVYTKVNAQPIANKEIIIDPKNEQQTFNGVYTDITVNKIQGDTLQVTPKTESQKFEGVYEIVNVDPITGETLDVTPSPEKQSFQGVFTNVNVSEAKGIDTSDATATADDMALNKTAYVNGEKITGKVNVITGSQSEQATRVTKIATSIGLETTITSPALFRANTKYMITTLETKVANAINLAPEQIVEGNTVLGVAGTTKATDTTDADATAEDIVLGKTAYVNGEKVVGTLASSDFNILAQYKSSTFSWTTWITKIGRLDLSKLTNMNNIFKGMYNLTEITGDLNTVKATSATSMFNGCSALIKGPQMNLSKVTSTYQMFYGCYQMTEIPEYDMRVCTNMQEMFYNCQALKKVIIKNTSKVTTMRSLFEKCNALEEVELDMTACTDIANMFANCSGTAHNINITLHNTSGLTSVNAMFYYNTCLKNAPEIDTSNVTNMNAFYLGAGNVITVPAYNAAKVTNIANAFVQAYDIEDFGGLIDLGKAYTATTTNNSSYALKFNDSTVMTHDSLMNVINNLYDLNLSYNVANGGTLYTQQLVLGSTNLAKLSAEEIRNSDS